MKKKAKAAPAPAKTSKSKVQSKKAAPAAPVATEAKVAAPKAIKKAAERKASRETAIAVSAQDMCREMGCEAIATTGGYCRAHYIKNWRKIKRKELILKEGKLNRYIEELVAKYPDKYIETIRNDLSNNAEFSKVVSELDLEEGLDDFDVDGENVDSLIDSIKRDIDDDSDTY